MISIKQIVRVLPVWMAGCLGAVSAQADIKEITPEHCALMVERNVISVNNPVSCERLRVVSFQHHSLNGGDAKSGEVVVLDALAKNVQTLFDTLYERGFPIGQSVLMEHYSGDDDVSMAANNTSAFNGRPITGGGSWSIHAYGAAIDVNPLQNPYISIAADGSARVHPVDAARQAVNRFDYRPDKARRVGRVEDVLDIFAENGFVHWGGYWNFPIDYQHFEVGSRRFVTQLASSSPRQAEVLFKQHVKNYRKCMAGTDIAPHEAARKHCAESVMK